jgi:hypothetical protein
MWNPIYANYLNANNYSVQTSKLICSILLSLSHSYMKGNATVCNGAVAMRAATML